MSDLMVQSSMFKVQGSASMPPPLLSSVPERCKGK
jgi:hypothetical protein